MCIYSIFNVEGSEEAMEKLNGLVAKYKKTAPKLCEWAEENIHEGLTVFNFPASHRRSLRTTNEVERLNREIKKRTRTATIFLNVESLLRLVTAIVTEISDEWETNIGSISIWRNRERTLHY